MNMVVELGLLVFIPAGLWRDVLVRVVIPPSLLMVIALLIHFLGRAGATNVRTGEPHAAVEGSTLPIEAGQAVSE